MSNLSNYGQLIEPKTQGIKSNTKTFSLANLSKLNIIVDEVPGFGDFLKEKLVFVFEVNEGIRDSFGNATNTRSIGRRSYINLLDGKVKSGAGGLIDMDSQGWGNANIRLPIQLGKLYGKRNDNNYNVPLAPRSLDIPYDEYYLVLDMNAAIITLHEINHGYHVYVNKGRFTHPNLSILGKIKWNPDDAQSQISSIDRKAMEMETYWLSWLDWKRKWKSTPYSDIVLHEIIKTNNINMVNYHSFGYPSSILGKNDDEITEIIGNMYDPAKLTPEPGGKYDDDSFIDIKQLVDYMKENPEWTTKQFGNYETMMNALEQAKKDQINKAFSKMINRTLNTP